MKVKAAVLHAPHRALSIETLDLEPPRDDEVRVRLVATGVCHTDISMIGRPFPVEQPIVLGHEGAGIVEAVGQAVTKVREGDRVVLSYNWCGTCPSCQAHAPSYCHDFFGTNFLGQRPDGSTALSREGGQPVRHNFFGQSSFASHCLCTQNNVVKVPDSVPRELFELLGPLGCGLQTGAGAVINVLKPRLGQSLAVFGAGAVGMAAIMAARAIGAGTIVAIDKVPERLELASELGATHTVDAGRVEDVPAHIARLAGSVDLSLDTTGVPAVLRQALDVLAPRGTCGFLGGAAPGAELAVDLRDMMIKGKTLRGIVEGDSDADRFIPALIDLQQRGRFPFEKLMRLYPFDRINEAIADSRSGRTIKPVLKF